MDVRKANVSGSKGIKTAKRWKKRQRIPGKSGLDTVLTDEEQTRHLQCAFLLLGVREQLLKAQEYNIDVIIYKAHTPHLCLSLDCYPFSTFKKALKKFCKPPFRASAAQQRQAIVTALTEAVRQASVEDIIKKNLKKWSMAFQSFDCSKPIVS
ncbi:MAG: hypothetical protein EZS28_022755 [Streblomastix strix]|uniref:DDE-1 domain-containing protein n=1 Tax=Streblomastix strix TaxID=222440 RepID=A0A5J4VH78_9EUKA|nr:MAG: hypothetical protein EZS28_022755 [Streblomastix strix]